MIGATNVSDFDDAVIVLIRDIVVRFIDMWGRVPSVLEIKAELSGKRGS